MDIKSISSHLGHTSTTTTLNIYAHKFRKAEKESADRLQILLAKSEKDESVTKVEETKENIQKAWDFALGLNKVDDLEPSQEFLELVEQEKQGLITDKDIEDYLNKKHFQKGNE